MGEITRGISPIVGAVLLIVVLVVLAALLTTMVMETQNTPDVHTGEVTISEGASSDSVEVRVVESGNAAQFLIRTNGTEYEIGADGRKELQYGSEISPGDPIHILSVNEAGEKKLIRSYTPRGSINFGAVLNVNVVDADNGNPISGASVTVNSSSDNNCGASLSSSECTLTTDGSGSESVDVADGGQYTVTASAPSYNSASQSTTILMEEQTVKISLEPKGGGPTGPATCAAHFNNNPGDGTASNPYQISTLNGLQCIAYSDYRTDHHVLTSDIDASATQPGNTWDSPNDLSIDESSGFRPIGTGSSPFTGTLSSGSGTYEISGLYIDRTSTSRVGVIGTLGSSGSLHDLSLSNIEIYSDGSTGSLVGFAKGPVYDITARNVVIESEGATVGGIVGQFSESLHDVTNTPDPGDVHSLSVSGSETHLVGPNTVGGVIGNIGQDNRVDNLSFADGTVIAVYSPGGIAGSYGTNHLTYESSNTEIHDASVNDATIRGIVGDGSMSSYTYSKNQLSYDAYDNRRGGLVGGIIGSNKGHTELYNVDVSGSTIKGELWVGGISGWVGEASPDDTSDSPVIDGGSVSDTTVHRTDYTDHSVAGERGVGGISSWIANGGVTDMSGSGLTVISEDGDNNAGIIGYLASDGSFSGSGTFTGEVQNNGADYIAPCIATESGSASYSCDITGP